MAESETSKAPDTRCGSPPSSSSPRATELLKTWMQIVKEDANANKTVDANANVDTNEKAIAEAKAKMNAFKGTKAGEFDIATALEAINIEIAVVTQEIEELKRRKRQRELQQLPVTMPQWLQEALDNEQDDPYRNYTQVLSRRMTASRVTSNFAFSLRLAQAKIFNAKYNYRDNNNYDDDNDNDSNSSNSDNDDNDI